MLDPGRALWQFLKLKGAMRKGAKWRVAQPRLPKLKGGKRKGAKVLRVGWRPEVGVKPAAQVSDLGMR